MKKLLTKQIGLCLGVLLLCTASCKKFLDVNTDPNNAADVNLPVLLPSAESGITFALGNTLAIDGGIWGQYWTQNPAASQYSLLEQYASSAGDFGNVWGNINNDALEDLQKVIQKGKETNKKQYVAIGMLLKAYTFQLSTDLWGDIPFSQALKGDDSVRIISPVYDKQSDIYNGLVSLVDSALVLIDDTDPNAPTTDDLIFQGDMDKWGHFANTLKLKIALRLSEKDPTRAQAIIATLAGADFLQPGEIAQQSFSSTGGQQNPLYGAIAGPILAKIQNAVASQTAIDFFNNNNDPRVAAFYKPAANGNYVGLPQGNYNNETPGVPVSTPAAITGGNATDPASALAPVMLMTDFESDFLQAEAIARGWLAGDAAAMYAQGISDNFADYGVDGADVYTAQPSVAYPTTGTLDAKIGAIITQKWAAMAGNQHIEAWIEWRRTGYPNFFVVSKASIIGAGRFPEIFLYPTTETTRNPNTPPQHLIYDKVWWATF